MLKFTRGILSNLRNYKTLCLFFGYIVIGQSYGIVGPTLVHMEYVLNTNTQGMAMSFSGDNIGAFCGAILCGLLFDKYNYESQFSYGYLWIAVFTSIAPWMPNVYLFCIMMTCRSALLGYVNSAGKPYMLKLWQGHRYKDAIFQASHASWSIGAFTIPLLVIPFLSKLPIRHPFSTGHRSHGNMSRQLIYSSPLSKDLINVKSEMIPDSNDIIIDEDFLNVRYTYAIIGVSAFFVSILFNSAVKQESQPSTASYPEVKVLPQERTQHYKTFQEQNAEMTLLKVRKIETLLTILIFIYTSFIIWQGTILGTFLSAFVIKGLHWPVQKGPLLTSVFRGFQGFGRLMGVPISMYIAPSKILMINMTLALTAYSAMLSAVVIFKSEILVWFATAMAGMALSNSYSTTILWGAQYLQIKAAYGSLFVAAASVGGMSSGFLAGYFFQHYEPVSVIYIILFASSANIFLFCIMNITAKLHDYYKNEQTNQNFCDAFFRSNYQIKSI